MILSELLFTKSRMVIRAVLLLTLSICLNQTTSFAQLYSYTNASSGVPASVATNLTGTSLGRGSGVSGANLSCTGATEGFGADGWPSTTNFNVTTFNANGEYITFTLTPDCGYSMTVTGFSARLRRQNQNGSQNDGPVSIRYGYSLDNGANWTTTSTGSPQSSNGCGNNGNLRIWQAFNNFTTSSPVLFRIYGLSSGSNGTGDLFLRNITVSGSVTQVSGATTCPGDQSVCIDETPFTLTGGSPTGGTYSGPGVSAGVFNPVTAGAGTHVITYSTSDESECTQSCTFSISVTENIANAGDDQSTCIDGFVQLDGVANEGSTWSDGNAGGLFLPDANSLNAYYIPPPGYSGDITLTLTPSGACATSDDVVLSFGVLPPLVLSVEGETTGVCGDEITVDVVAVSGFNQIGSLQFSVNWDQSLLAYLGVDGLAIGGGTPFITDINSANGQLTYSWLDPSGSAGEDLAPGTILFSITYSVTDNTGSAGVSISDNPLTIEAITAQLCPITVMASPLNISLSPITVTCPDDFAICSTADPVELTGADPAGGLYAGTGVVDGSFDPSVAGPGDHEITYTYTDLQSGCSNECTFTITVNAFTAPEITVEETSGLTDNDGVICAGDNVMLTATGGSSYLWSTGGETAIINPFPESTTEFSVTVSGGNGCTAVVSTTITVNPLPVPEIAVTDNSGLTENDGIICEGDEVTLTGSGGGSYEWSNQSTDAEILVAPTETTSYSLTVTDANGCTASTAFTVVVNLLPEAVIVVSEESGNTDNDDIICDGDDVLLSASGGVSYLWDNGDTEAEISLSPDMTATYTVTVTSEEGCTDVASVTITVNPAPQAAIAVAETSGNTNDDGTICFGASVTLTASGGILYSWSNESGDAEITVTPEETTTYTVTVKNADGCTAVASQTITVNPLPQAAIVVTETSGSASDDGAICIGGSATLTASGGTAYSWSTMSTDAAINVTPTTTTTYTVTVTNADGCTVSVTQTIIVDPLPEPTIQVAETSGTTNNDGTICVGASVELTAGGGVGYQWGNEDSGAGIIVSPTETTTYTVTVTSAAGCTATATVTLTVNPLPQVSISVTETSGSTDDDGIICSGNPVTLTATGGGTYAWSNEGDMASITVNPGETITYTVTVTNANGCSATASQTITVNAVPVPVIAVTETSGTSNNDGVLCAGASANLMASGGVSFNWSTGETTAEITVTPTATTTYTVTVTNADGCTATATQLIVVNPAPTPSITVSETSGNTNNDAVICIGASVTLTGNGGTSYAWNTNEGSTSITVSPTETTTYTVTVTNANGCTATATRTITVNPLPTPVVVVSETSGTTNDDGTICIGASATLTTSGGVSYNWSTGDATAATTVTPTSTTTYTVTVTNANGCTATATQTIIVNPLPVPVIAVTETSGTSNNDAVICPGASATLTASGGVSFNWSTGETTAEITVTPTVTTTYTVTVTNSDGCSATTSQTIMVIPAPTPSITVSETSGNANNDAVICIGASVTLTGNGGTDYAWNTNEATTSITVSPTETTTYTVTVTNANGCTATATRTITVNPLPTPVVVVSETSGTTNDDGTICIGASATLTASGGVSYNWSTGDATAATTVTPTSTTTYTVTVTNANGCTATATQTIIVNPLPVPVIAVTETSGTSNNDAVICPGASATLTASGGVSFNWSTGETTAEITVTPTATTTYTVTVTNSDGCSATTSQTIVVIPAPTPSITVSETSGNANNDAVICIGASVTLTGNGGTDYAWNTNEATTSITVSPTETTTYTVTVTNANGCTATATRTITVNPLPTPVVAVTETSGTTNDDGTICIGASATLTASGGVSYNWSTGDATAATTVTPTSTTTYTVTVTNSNGCSATATQTIIVNPLPVPVIAVTETSGTSNNDAVICPGASATLTASGGVSFNWGTGETTAEITVTPTVTTTYTVTVTNSDGCTATATQTIVVIPTPTPTITVSETSGNTNDDAVICIGASVTLTGNGGTTYAWNTNEGSTSITVSPTETTTYTVTVTNANGCTATATRTITVNPLPTPAAAVSETSGTTNNDGTICLGASATLTASGGLLYSWSTGATTSATTVTPTGTTTYTVIVTNANGCSATATITIVVNPLPQAAIAVSETSGTTNNDGIICVGASAFLTASGGTSYAWSTGDNSPSTTVTPTVTSTYTVTVTNANGCTATATQIITVNPLPTPAIAVTETSGTTNNDGTICVGASATLTASGGTSYSWSTGANTAGITVTPEETGTYTVTVTNANGCTATATSTITVNPLPTPSIAVSETSGTTNNDGTICVGASATLTASGGVSYNWSTGAATAATTVAPTATTTYTVTVTNANGCSATATITIVVNPLPQAAIAVSETSGTTNNDGIICVGASAFLTASGGTSYAWSTGDNSPSTTVTPTLTSTYTVTVTNANGCTATATQIITVNPLPTPAIAVTETSGTTNNDGTICVGASVTLTASGGTSYSWSTGANTAGITVTPNETSTYTVTVTNANGCSATATRTITVNPLPTPSIAVSETSGTTNNDGTICVGASATLTASGGVSYNWSTGAATAATTVAPTATTTYTVTVTNANGCSATATITIVVNPLPQAAIAVSETSGTTNNDGIICLGASAFLTASGGTSYAWSTGDNSPSTTVTPTVTSTYTVTVTNANGCTATATQIITVNPLPTPAIAVTETSGTTNNDGSICVGASATLTASGGTSYSWSTGANTAGITVSPEETGTYTVTVTNANGCTATATQTIIVNPLPEVIISINESSGMPNDGILCTGGIVSLTASGGNVYLWSTGATTATIQVAPVLTSTYTVTVTNAAGCTASSSTTISVVFDIVPPVWVTAVSALNTSVECSNAQALLDAQALTPVASDNLTGYTIVKTSGPFVPNGQCPQLGTYTNTWIATDGCGNTSVPYQQLITIVDFTPPTVVPGSIASCYPTASAAQAAAINATGGSDLCSSVTKSAVVTGTCSATVVVTVSDCFGNTATATYSTRIDNSGPALTEGTLNPCYGTVQEAENAAKAATAISENCPGDLIVSASSVGTCPTVITVTVTDGCGNSSSVVYGDNGQTICIGSSTVEITTEASNQTVDCVNETTALSAWLANHGGAVATGLGVVWTNSTPNFVFNCSTHSKSAVVTFTATDNCGFTDQTTATFTVTDNVAPSANSISTTNLSCITNLPAPNFNLLTGLSDNCDASLTLALFSNTQNNGTGCPGNPLILLRTYSVTDDYCNTTFVTHTINVVDNVAPTFTAPANTTVNVDANCNFNASTTVTGDVTNEQDNCSTGLNATYTDVTTPATGFQNVFVITRTWVLTDNCGNTASSQVQTITVKDVTPPTIVCPGPVTASGSLADNICTATIGSIDPVSTSDNCGSSVTISYTLSGATTGSGSGTASGRIFKEGETTVTYTATDRVGNTTTCSFVVTVNCTTVSGKIIWEHNHALGVKDATVRLAFGVTQIGSTLSDVNGNYLLTVPGNGNFSITPVKNINRLNGVTAADATAIQNHINGTSIITDPYKKVAADVNRTGFITTQDVSIITQCLAGNPTALAIFNVFWRFTPTSYVMPVTPQNTVATFPENITLSITGPDVTGQDFYGMKIGDVNGSANPALAPSGSPLVWMLQDQTLQAGTEIELNFNTANFTDLAALQFALDFDPSYLQFEAFKSLDAIPLTSDNFGAFDAEQGELRVVWSQSGGITLADGTPVLSVRFKVLQGGKKLSDVLILGDSYLPCKAYTAALLEGDIRLVYNSSVATNEAGTLGKPQLVLYQNQPNPFVGATNIGFVLPGACDAKLRIMDASGRELTQYDRTYTAGYHEIEFRMENAASYGILYYELITPFGTLSKKMVTTGK